MARALFDGQSAAQTGPRRRGRSLFQTSGAIDPNNPRVLTYLAQVLASDENPQIRDGNHALAMAAKANDLTGGVEPAMIDALAMAYAELGRFTNAQQAAADALKLATAYNMTNDVAAHPATIAALPKPPAVPPVLPPPTRR